MSTTTVTRLTAAEHYDRAEELLADATECRGALADRQVAAAHVHALLASMPRPHDLTYGRPFAAGGVL